MTPSAVLSDRVSVRETARTQERTAAVIFTEPHSAALWLCVSRVRMCRVVAMDEHKTHSIEHLKRSSRPLSPAGALPSRLTYLVSVA